MLESSEYWKCALNLKLLTLIGKRQGVPLFRDIVGASPIHSELVGRAGQGRKEKSRVTHSSSAFLSCPVLHCERFLGGASWVVDSASGWVTVINCGF